MIFTGRLLAHGDGVAVWQDDEKGTVALHLVERGLVISLSPDELAELARASTTALATLQSPEAEKDLLRRLQILQARVADHLKRERERRGARET